MNESDPNRRVLGLIGGAVLLVACAAPIPSRTPPAPTAAPTPAPTPAQTAALASPDISPQIVCGPAANWSTTDENGSMIPLVPVLTCENGVAAAMEGLPVDHLPIRAIEFQYGGWCPPGARCAMTRPTLGYVVFRVEGRGPDLWVSVFVDESGNAAAGEIGPFPPGT